MRWPPRRNSPRPLRTQQRLPAHPDEKGSVGVVAATDR